MSYKDEIKARYAKGYEKWTPEEDTFLGKAFQDWQNQRQFSFARLVAELSVRLERNPGAIRSRLFPRSKKDANKQKVKKTVSINEGKRR